MADAPNEIATTKVGHFAFSAAEFVVINVETLGFVACLLGMLIHFYLERSLTSRKAFTLLVQRLFSAGSAPMVPALLACSAYSELVPKLQGVTIQLFVSAVALGVVVVMSFMDWTE